MEEVASKIERILKSLESEVEELSDKYEELSDKGQTAFYIAQSIGEKQTQIESMKIYLRSKSESA